MSLEDLKLKDNIKFEKYLKKDKYNYLRETELNKTFNSGINGNIPDFLIENKIIIDFKAKKFIIKEDYYQMLRYLEIANLPLGIIVNFRNTYLKPKRIINSKFNSVSHSSYSSEDSGYSGRQ
jgi:GxxExxY protein